MGAAVIPYAFAGRIGIDFGIFDFDLDFADFGTLEVLDLPFCACLSPSRRIGGLVVCAELGLGIGQVVFGRLGSSWTLLGMNCLLSTWINLGLSC
jgi:hypothetical protein